MKLEILDLSIDELSFRDRYGKFRKVYGCSMRGGEEFKAYLKKLCAILEESTGGVIPSGSNLTNILKNLYLNNAVFQYCCDECLRLNNVDPDWLDNEGLLLEALLFQHNDHPGLLVRLNTPDQSMIEARTDTTGNSATIEDLAAVLLGLTNDLDKAIETLDKHPAKLVTGILKARSEQIAEASTDDKQKRKKWAEQQRKQPKRPIDPKKMQRVK